MPEKGPMTGSSGRIPSPYLHDVKVDHGLMHYPPFERMDIGARASGLPSAASEGPKSLEHVGGSVGKRGKEGR